MLRVLILGGTTEARQLAERLAVMPGIDATLSLAGRTQAPVPVAVRTRIGGFGGAEGLARHLAADGVGVLVDATHPFALRISASARAAARVADVPLLALGRPPWSPEPGDRWTRVATMAAAAAALGPTPRTVFLAIGRQQVAAFRAAPQHRYLVRSVEPPDPADLPPDSRRLLARGPFAEAEERDLLRTRRIDVLVTKNSGGPATYGKIAAARALGLPVVMVDRDEAGGLTPEAVVAHLAALAAKRGV